MTARQVANTGVNPAGVLGLAAVLAVGAFVWYCCWSTTTLARADE